MHLPQEEKPEPQQRSGPDTAGVQIPPPVIFAICLLVGLVIDSAWFQGRLAAEILMVVGAVFVLAGLALIVTCVRRFRRLGTALEPWKPTTALSKDGPYLYSRNPMYVSLALIHAGLAIAAGSFAALFSLGVAIALIQAFVIRREEDYLEMKFGEEYLEYKTRVRRWL